MTGDARREFRISGHFTLSPLLIRSSDPLLPADDMPDGQVWHLPDVTQLRSHRETPGLCAVLPGTSLTGALRSRATMILNTIAPDPDKVQELIDDIFGFDMHAGDPAKARPVASRLIVEERPLEAGHLQVQNRVAIDRFTGGAFDTALFSEAPWFGGEVELRLVLRHDSLPADQTEAETQLAAEQARIGLLLLLLKDLWSGDVPVGGSTGIGRGFLQGINATLESTFDNVAPDTADPDEANPKKCWKLHKTETGLTVTGQPAQALEGYVAALHRYLEAQP
jgi:CRISPR/Cas system CSM-associated protein Csm3 (group 7 of RAMP superfamily)